MTNNLFDEPKLDEFKTESPLRAFASFDMMGLYLIAKGFRPSLGHLTRYLDAMEKKEGWQFVQLLEAATGAPTIIFRQSKGDLLEQFTGSEAMIETLREQLNKGHTRIQTWSIHAAHPDAPAWIDPEKEEEARKHMSRLGLSLGGEEVYPHPLEAPYGDFTLTIKGLDPEKIIWNRVQWRGEIEKLFQAARERPHHVKVKDFLRRENVTNMSHYYRTASVASVLRLIDMFEGWDAYSLDEYISDDALFTAIGWTNPKARKACNTDPYAAVAAAIRETEVTSSPVDVKVEQMEPGTRIVDDPLNPNHYNGRECADIGERLSANGYQILKYCWRLGKKDDPCQELGKALWYLESELALMRAKGHPNRRTANKRGIAGDTDQWIYGRLNGQSEFTQRVALFLWNGYDSETLQRLKAIIADHKATLDCGHGLAL